MGPIPLQLFCTATLFSILEMFLYLRPTLTIQGIAIGLGPERERSKQAPSKLPGCASICFHVHLSVVFACTEHVNK